MGRLVLNLYTHCIDSSQPKPFLGPRYQSSRILCLAQALILYLESVTATALSKPVIVLAHGVRILRNEEDGKTYIHLS